MTKLQFNKLIALLYVTGGAALFLFFAAEFLFRMLMAVIGLILVNKGLQMFGVNVTGMFMQQWYLRNMRR